MLYGVISHFKIMNKNNSQNTFKSFNLFTKSEIKSKSYKALTWKLFETLIIL